MRARGVRLVAAILGVAMLGGCTSTSAGDPRPAPTGQSKPESSPSSPSNEQDALPSDGAPKVTSPMEADTFQQDPCQALTASQATGLNVVFPGKPFKGQFGNGCEWKGPDYNGGSAAIDFVSDDPRGMSSVYRSNSRGEFAFFEALEPFAGHPMAAFGIADTREEGGRCAVAVGLTDELAFGVFLYLSTDNIGHKDPCAIASQVGRMMLTTMGAS